MRMLQQKLPSVPNKEQPDQASSSSKYTSFIDQYFGGTLDSTYPLFYFIYIYNLNKNFITR